MELPEYRRLYELEERMWWFRGMERISLALLRRYSAEDRPVRVLDAGCGTGGMLEPLARLGSAVGIDRSPEALKFAHQRGQPHLARADIGKLPFMAASFDVVTSFDVLYHLDVDDDVAALREIARVLRPGGQLLIRVPANDSLRSSHDKAVHTRQRYGKQELISKLHAAGLEPEHTSFANCFLYPVALLRRRAESWLGGGKEESEVQGAGALLNALLAIPLMIEARLIPRVALPFGLSLVAVARKK